MFTLEFTRRFSMAHRLLSDAASPCIVPHGHNEVVTVRLQATAPAPLDGAANMVEPFAQAKGTWHRFVDQHLDHGFQLSAADPLLGWFQAQEPQHIARLVVTPGDPTTEVLACCLMAKLNAFLAAEGGRLRCTSIRLEETPTNVVEFAGDALAALPAGPGWWTRADMSVNDLAPPPRPALRAVR